MHSVERKFNATTKCAAQIFKMKNSINNMLAAIELAQEGYEIRGGTYTYSALEAQTISILAVAKGRFIIPFNDTGYFWKGKPQKLSATP